MRKRLSYLNSNSLQDRFNVSLQDLSWNITTYRSSEFVCTDDSYWHWICRSQLQRWGINGILKRPNISKLTPAASKLNDIFQWAVLADTEISCDGKRTDSLTLEFHGLMASFQCFCTIPCGDKTTQAMVTCFSLVMDLEYKTSQGMWSCSKIATKYRHIFSRRNHLYVYTWKDMWNF